MSDWGSGRTMDASVTNKSTTPTSSWRVTFAWPQDITPWNAARVAYAGGSVTVGNAAWNGSLGSGATTTFGFSDASASLPKPTACTAVVNGAPVACTLIR